MSHCMEYHLQLWPLMSITNTLLGPVTGDFSAEKQYVLDEMQQRLAALREDQALSRREKEQIIVIAVCSVF